MSIYYIPHGGGPLPLLNHSSQTEVIRELRQLGLDLAEDIANFRYKRVVVFSAHYEADPIAIHAYTGQSLLYDYSGFPPESYEIKYPAQTDLNFAEGLRDSLMLSGIPVQLETERPWDHGYFVPLKLIFPDASLPVVGVSLKDNLDPVYHLELGKRLSEFDDGQTLWLGSGSSFHNLRLMFSGDPSQGEYAKKFNAWLSDRLLQGNEEGWEALSYWRSGPAAEFCHPREEHLIPLHLCQGIARGLNLNCEELFSAEMMGQELMAWKWT